MSGYTAVEASGSSYRRYKGCPHNWYHQYRCYNWWWRRRHRHCCSGNQGLNDPHNLRVDAQATSVVRFTLPAGESTRRAVVRFYVRDTSPQAPVLSVRVVGDNNVPNTEHIVTGRPGARGSQVCTARLLARGSAFECDVTDTVNKRRDKQQERHLTFELYGVQGHARLSSGHTADRRERPQLLLEDNAGCAWCCGCPGPPRRAAIHPHCACHCLVA